MRKKLSHKTLQFHHLARLLNPNLIPPHPKFNVQKYVKTQYKHAQVEFNRGCLSQSRRRLSKLLFYMNYRLDKACSSATFKFFQDVFPKIRYLYGQILEQSGDTKGALKQYQLCAERGVTAAVYSYVQLKNNQLYGADRQTASFYPVKEKLGKESRIRSILSNFRYSPIHFYSAGQDQNPALQQPGGSECESQKYISLATRQLIAGVAALYEAADMSWAPFHIRVGLCSMVLRDAKRCEDPCLIIPLCDTLIKIATVDKDVSNHFLKTNNNLKKLISMWASQISFEDRSDAQDTVESVCDVIMLLFPESWQCFHPDLKHMICGLQRRGGDTALLESLFEFSV